MISRKTLQRSMLAGALLSATITCAVWLVGQRGPTLITGWNENPEWVGIAKVDKATWDSIRSHDTSLVRSSVGQYPWHPYVVRGPSNVPLVILGAEGVGIAVDDLMSLRAIGVIPYWVVGAGLILPLAMLVSIVRAVIHIATQLYRRQVAFSRSKRGLCVTCSYPRLGLGSRACPECGAMPSEADDRPFGQRPSHDVRL